MKISRRDFLKYCTASAAVLGLHSALGPLGQALAASSGPPVIWLKGSGCTGCTVSLTNRISSSAPVDFADLLINTVNLAFHPTVMAASGDLAVQSLREAEAGSFILVVEGGIPTLYNGKTCIVWSENGQDVTALAAVKQLAVKAKRVVCVGSCAAYGGMSAAAPNPTAIRGVQAATGIATINVPGCPPHPDWVVATLAQLLAGRTIELDTQRRPKSIYGATVHSKCPRRDKAWATSLSQTGLCMSNLGCKGRTTYSDCPTRRWNNGVNWCVNSDSLCQGCTESGFPDKFAPLFSTMGALSKGHKTVSPVRTTCTSCHGKKG